MKSLQKTGGIAAFYEAAAYIIGMIGFLGFVDVSSIPDPAGKIALMADHLAFLYTLHILVYVVWGVGMVILSLALHDRLKSGAPALAQVGTAFGLFWGCVIILSGMITNVGMQTVVNLAANDPAQAATVWLTIEAILAGFAGGNEAIGGLWMVLTNLAALKTGAFSPALTYLGMAVGMAGIVSLIPPIATVSIAVFALGQIVWFVWVGVGMVRGGGQRSTHNFNKG